MLHQMSLSRRLLARHSLVACSRGAASALSATSLTAAHASPCAHMIATSASASSAVASFSTLRAHLQSSSVVESSSSPRLVGRSTWKVAPNPQLIALGDLQPLPGTIKKARRIGRGVGSGWGKTAGKGHKGQGQRKGLRKRGFEGGSTPFWRRTPKLGITNAQRYWKMLTPLTVAKIQTFVKLGRIDASQLITMRTLYDSGCISKSEHGVKLLSGGLTTLDQPLHIQLTDCSEQARTLLESTGGSLHLVWFNRTTLRAHLNPLRFLQQHGRLPKSTGVPPPKKAAKYGYVVEHVDY